MMEMSSEKNFALVQKMLFKRIKFNTSFIGSFKIVVSRLKQGNHSFKTINSLKEKFTWLLTVNGSFNFFLPPPESEFF